MFRSTNGFFVFTNCALFALALICQTAKANPDNAALVLRKDVSLLAAARITLAEAEANRAYKSLSAAEVVQATLTDSLPMRTAVSGFILQAQRLGRVARAEFDPKLSTSASTQRSGSAASGVT